jgi:pimeloyl-ACP methyl ester carboxylesterase
MQNSARFKESTFMTKKLAPNFEGNSILHSHRLHFFALALFILAALVLSPRLEASFASTNPSSTQEQKTSSTGNTAATGEAKSTTLDGARINYVNYGKGSEALVLIHGWTCNIDNWRDQMPEFAKRTRVIAIDLPGHGKSDKPQITYSMDLFARNVDAVMRDAGVTRSVLVGHSMGTPVARQFYRKHPDKTLAIVIVDGPLRPFGDKAMMDRFIAGFKAENYRDSLAQMFASMSGPNLPSDAHERIKNSYMNTPQHVVVSAMEGMGDPSIWGEDKINVPVLAIMARNPFYPPDIEQRSKAIAPNMEWQMWEGVGHFIMMEKPKEFNLAVLAFLDKNKLLK